LKGGARNRTLYSPKDGNEREIIGIVKDVKFAGLTEEPVMMDYIPYTQYGTFYLNDFAAR
jgi:hypothetical protein